MRLTGSLAYTRPTPIPKMPPGLVELMEGLAKDVLRSNPSDVYAFCAGHMQKLLEIRDGPPKKYMSLEQRISKAQEKIRQRAEQRQEKYNQQMQIHECPEDKLTSNGNEDQTIEKTHFRTPIHQELNLIDSSEIEISHSATSPDIKSNDEDKQNVQEIKEKSDAVSEEKQIEITQEDITSTIKSVADLKSENPVVENKNAAIESCENISKLDECKQIEERINNDAEILISAENEVIVPTKESFIESENIHTENERVSATENTQPKLDETELDNIDIFNNENGKTVDSIPEYIRKPRSTNYTEENFDSQPAHGIKNTNDDGEVHDIVTDVDRLVLDNKTLIKLNNEPHGNITVFKETPEICYSYNELNIENKVMETKKQVINDKSTLLSNKTTENNISISQGPFDRDTNVVKSDNVMTEIFKKSSDEKSELLTIETLKKHNSDNKDENGHSDVKPKEDKNVDRNNDEIENKNGNQVESSLVNSKPENDKNDKNEEAEAKLLTENNNNVTSQEKETQESVFSKALNKCDSKSKSVYNEEIKTKTSTEDTLLTEKDIKTISQVKEVQSPVISKELNISEFKSENNKNEETVTSMSTEHNSLTENDINVISQEKEIQESIVTKELNRSLEISPGINLDNNSDESNNVTAESDNKIKINVVENATAISEGRYLEFSPSTISSLAESQNNECFNEAASKSNIQVAELNSRNNKGDNPIQPNTKVHANVNTAQNVDNPACMDLETAAITIQKVFRSFLFKSRASTFEDSANDENNLLEENDETKKDDDLHFTNTNKERRAHGISRMDTVLQTVNEEKSLSLSTDDSSTLSSAATTIQAHVRGFLARNKLNSNKTIFSNSLVNSDGLSSTSQDNDGESKNKTILNIHIVPEGGHFLSRDESMITSIDLPLDGSPPSSINVHPLGYDKSEPRKQLKREDAIQSLSPPSNNSGKLSEDVDSIKELVINDNELTTGVQNVNNSVTHIETVESREAIPTNSITMETIIEADKDVENMSDQKSETNVKQGVLTNMSSDEMDVITPFEERDTTPVDSDNSLRLLHSGEFHDVVLPTKVSRSDTSIVRGE